MRSRPTQRGRAQALGGRVRAPGGNQVPPASRCCGQRGGHRTLSCRKRPVAAKSPCGLGTVPTSQLTMALCPHTESLSSTNTDSGTLNSWTHLHFAGMWWGVGGEGKLATCAWGWGVTGPRVLLSAVPGNTHAPRKTRCRSRDAPPAAPDPHEGSRRPGGRGPSSGNEAERGHALGPRGTAWQRGETGRAPHPPQRLWGGAAPRPRPEDCVPLTPSRTAGQARLCHGPRRLSPLAAPRIRAAENPHTLHTRPPWPTHTRPARTGPGGAAGHSSQARPPARPRGSPPFPPVPPPTITPQRGLGARGQQAAGPGSPQGAWRACLRAAAHGFGTQWWVALHLRLTSMAARPGRGGATLPGPLQNPPGWQGATRC